MIEPINSGTHVVVLPLFIQLSKKKRFYLNLNNYRNSHYMVLNNSKRIFESQIIKELKNIPPIINFEIHYYFYSPNKIVRDLANVVSIVDKYFCDTLSEVGIIEDDNTDFLKHVSMTFGGMDRDNPRVEAHIKVLKYKESKNPMKIILEKKEFDVAVRQFLLDFNIISEDTETEIKFSGSGDNITAEITTEISGIEYPESPEKPKQRRTRRTSAQVAQEKKEEAKEKAAVADDPVIKTEEKAEEPKKEFTPEVKTEEDPSNPFGNVPVKEEDSPFVTEDKPKDTISTGSALFGDLTNI